MGYFKEYSGLSKRARANLGRAKGPVEIEFEGVDDLMTILEQLPLRFSKKPVLATLRKGTNEFTKELRKNTPSEMAELKKLIKSRAGKGGEITIKAGFFAGIAEVETKSGKTFDPYYILYWKNYGTLSNRAASHVFDRTRKSISSGWSGGIRPGLFVERSWDKSKSAVEEKIETDFETQTMKFLNKHKVD